MKLTFEEALKKLNIEDYGERIFNSNSHGELFHLQDYIILAEMPGDCCNEFKEWFVEVVEQADIKWSRPESVFQHIPRLLLGSVNEE